MAGQESDVFKLLAFAIRGDTTCRFQSLNDEDERVLSGIYNACNEMLERDYHCAVLDNNEAQLCSTYPVKITIPLIARERLIDGSDAENAAHINKMSELVYRSRFARTRGRFVVPVLLINGKHVCRSSTLARSPEIYYRSGYGYLVQGGTIDNDSENAPTSEQPPKNDSGDLLLSEYENGNKPETYENSDHSASDSLQNPDLLAQSLNVNSRNKEWLLDKMRNADINLLHYLKVDTIFDLMVEKKKVKFGMNVTSSEKVDRQQRYSKFNLLSVPYPGCEFFTEYRDLHYAGEGLMFDWTQAFVDADIHVPDNVQYLKEIDWKDYIKWDLIQLTQNYLKLLLCSLMGDKSNGILLHCISGWDRTPLFISLVRLSLWADGLAHQSLSAEEMVYFTIAYDWFLYSHQFTSRIEKGEEIFYFCFDFLKYIESDEFSVIPHLTDRKSIKCSANINPESNARAFYEENSSVSIGQPEQAVDAMNYHYTTGSDHVQNLNGTNGTQNERDKVQVTVNGCAVHYQGTLNKLPPGDEHRSESVQAESSDVAVMDVKESCSWTPKEFQCVESTENVVPLDSSHSTNGIVHATSNGECVDEAEILSLENMNSLSYNENTGQDKSEVIRRYSVPGTSTNGKFENGHVKSSVSETVGMSENGIGLSNCGGTSKPMHSNWRKKKLEDARKILIPAYQAAVQRQRDHDEQNNSALSSLFLSISRATLNLVKR